jgi:Pyridoxamine 5'-phosphate oxidase
MPEQHVINRQAALPKRQRRARRIATPKAELDAFLTDERICRVATASQDGPHLTPLWYVWDGTALWLYSVVKSQRWTDVSRDQRVAVLVDAGEAYSQLRGAELRGAVEIVGEVPRTGTPDARLAQPERLYARKYGGTDVMYHTGHHAWLRLAPDKITSWDFRKKASAEDYDFG